MGRPERHDADYFPFYAKDGRTLFILEQKYQCKGTGFFTNVMRFLTLQEDHYFCIADETDKLYFFAKCHCDTESGMDMLNLMAKSRKIDAGLWVSSAVIVSQDLLKSLEEAYRKRKNKIITIEEIAQKYVSTAVNEVTTAVNEVTSGINPQRKGKERKEKKKKVFIPPTLNDVISYFKEKGYKVEIAKKAFESYSVADWHDTNGRPVLNWKQKMINVWFKDENKETKKDRIIRNMTDAEIRRELDRDA